MVRAILTDLDKDKLVQNLPSSCKNTCTHVGENATMNIWLQENTDCSNCLKKFNVLSPLDMQRLAIFVACVRLFHTEQGRSRVSGTNTQAESRTIRSVNITQVSFEGNVQRRGSTAEQEAYLLFIYTHVAHNWYVGQR